MVPPSDSAAPAPDPVRALERAERAIAAREEEIRALMPEPDRFPRLRREVEELERRFPDSAARPPLYGWLLGVKDVFRVDGLPTTAGSRLPPALFDGPEAACVTALRRAGALVLGKTVSTEFAFFAPGPTRNPVRPEHTPGGSSSGSAAAVAAGYCELALGTQTYGSVSRPAAFCGVVGFKPSYDRISRQGLVPLSPSLDHVGVLARRVAAVARAAAVLCRGWRPAPAGRRPVLGVPEGPYLQDASAAARESFEGTVRALEEAGWRVVRAPAFDDPGAIRQRHEVVVAAEAAAVHREWYAEHGSLYHPKLRQLIQRGARVEPDELERARAGRQRLRGELAERQRRHGIDLWIAPAAPGPAPRGLESTGDPVMNTPWTHAGVPTLALPAGTVDGMPVGLQAAAEFGADEELLAWGRSLERALARRYHRAES